MYNDYHLNRVPQHFDSIISPDVVCDMPTDSVLGDESHLYDTLCPINPLTGHRDSMLSRLFSGNVSDTEKQLILSQLATLKGVNSPRDLSDEDLISLIPSRYMSDPVEMERYRAVVDELRNSVDEPVEPVEPTPPTPAPTPTAE
nr:MAG TPA: hypothetical protein [Microviridae sp.]